MEDSWKAEKPLILFTEGYKDLYKDFIRFIQCKKVFDDAI